MSLTERQKAAARRNVLFYRARNLLRECEAALDEREQRVLKLGVKNWLESFQRDVEQQ